MHESLNEFELGKIRSRTTELAALLRLEKIAIHRFKWRKEFFNIFSDVVDSTFLIHSGNENRH